MVDILLASYNGEEYIADQIRSIQGQSYSNWRLLIRDDGSSDRTVEIINQIAKHDHRISLLSDHYGNKGVIGNFEILLKHSSADYIMFSDQDDIWLPDKISLSLNEIKKTEDENRGSAVLVFSDAYVVDNNLKIINNSYIKAERYDRIISSNFDELIIRNCIMGCTVMINSVAKGLVLPFNKYVLMHDWWIGMIVARYGKIKYLNSQTILYRQHEHNQVGSGRINRQYFYDRLLHAWRIVNINYKYYRMLKYLPFNVNIWGCIKAKLRLSLADFNQIKKEKA